MAYANDMRLRSEQNRVAGGAVYEPWAGSSGATRATGLALFLFALVVRLAFLPIANNNGTDAWARFLIARAWLQHPSQLPSDVWLPLPFWLLGGALRVWNSEYSARLLTVLLGSATMLPYWGFVRRIFGDQVALWSGICFALFGFHIAYSTTTSSEGPTILFLMIGVYFWVRLYWEDRLPWLFLSGMAISAACLCRVEPWLYVPVLGLLLLLLGTNQAGRSLSRTWRRAVEFCLVAGMGGAGWVAYSWFRWRQPFAIASRSASQSAHFSIQPPLVTRLIAVPGALVITLSPFLIVLAILGVYWIRNRAAKLMFFPALLAIPLIAFNFFVSITENLTMARYSLMYSWLLIPYVFAGLAALAETRPTIRLRTIFAATLVCFLLWQGAVWAGAYWGPPKVADKLSSVAPTLPLELELRNLVRWLQQNRAPQGAMVLDHFNYEAEDVARYAHIPAADIFQVPDRVDPVELKTQLDVFVAARHPGLLLYSPSGLLRTVWPIKNSHVATDSTDLVLARQWEGGDWRVYGISYPSNP